MKLYYTCEVKCPPAQSRYRCVDILERKKRTERFSKKLSPRKTNKWDIRLEVLKEKNEKKINIKERPILH